MITRPDPEEVQHVVLRELREMIHCYLLLDEDSVVVDVGAADGAYADLFARRARRCVCFECLPLRAESLLAHLPENCEVYPYALSDRNGTAVACTPVCDTPDYEDLTSLERLTPESFADMFDIPQNLELRTSVVETRRLDDVFQYERLDLMKVDVEGHECAVIRGAMGLIQRHLPVILVEIEERLGGSVSTLLRVLGECGYDCFFYNDRKLAPISEFDVNIHQSLDNYHQYVRNFMFLPT